MERLKYNKNALMLFITTILLIIEYLTFIVLISQRNYDTNHTINFSNIVFTLGYIVFAFYQIRAGFSYAINNNWKKPAMVIGIIQSSLYCLLSALFTSHLGESILSTMVVTLLIILFISNLFYVANTALLKEDAPKIYKPNDSDENGDPIIKEYGYKDIIAKHHKKNKGKVKPETVDVDEY